MTDWRERYLNDASRRILVQSNYDPHFSTLEDRAQMETRLFLARWDALQVANGRKASRWRSKSSQLVYSELCRGKLELTYNRALIEGDRVVVYQSEDGKIYLRPEVEFDDGRYEAMPS
jgi:hypothetical protein